MDVYTKKAFLGSKKIYLSISKKQNDIPKHRHEFLELLYVCNGAVTNIVDNKEFRLKQGNYIIFDYNVSHSTIRKTRDFIGLNCLFLPEYIDIAMQNCQSFKDLLQCQLVNYSISENNCNSLLMFDDANKKVYSLLTEMLEEQNSEKPGSFEYMRGCLLLILILSMRKYQYAIQKSELDPVLQKILNYIHDNYNQKISLDLLSNKFGYSKSHISYLFKKGVNTTYADYLLKTRISAACNILKNNQKKLDIESVAELVGYHDVRSFRKAFKESTGHTPKFFKKY